MTLIEKLETLRKSWTLVFGTTPPGDDIFFRWLRVATVESIEKSFMKSASWQNTQRVRPTQAQLERRIKSTIFWMRSQSQE